MGGMRLVWIDELSKKKITNNERTRRRDENRKRGMFGQATFKHIKLFVLSNNKPNISADETAVYNRYKQISYGSHFDRRAKEWKTLIVYCLYDTTLRLKTLF
jgi:hypothetical protein